MHSASDFGYSIEGQLERDAGTRSRRFEIIWPERRFVSGDQIRLWYGDAVANGEAEETELRDPEEMARELSSIGHITLGRGR